MATICYLLSHGFSARMVLHSQLAEVISEGLGTIVLCAPDSAVNSLTLSNHNGKIAIAGVEFADKKLMRTQLAEARRYLKEPIRGNAALWSQHLYCRNAAPRRLQNAQAALHYFGHRILYRSALAHRCFDAMDRAAHRSRDINRRLKEMNPDVVVSTYPVTAFETCCLLEAQSLKIPTVGHLLSWDNITCKGRFAAPPDYYVSWGPVMTEELREVYDVPAERIFECGVPHFDRHKQLVDPAYQAALLRQLGLDPNRPFLLFGMSAPIFAPFEIDVVEWLAEQVIRGRFGAEMQLVIRPHPQNVIGNMADASWLPRLERLGGSRVALNKPLLLDGGLPWGMQIEDMKVLVNLLAGCAVCLNSGSTLSIDALIHDKPVVVTLFDADHELPWWRSARRIRDFPHYRKLLAMGGVQPVASFAELELQLDRYLEHPERDQDARKLTIARECGTVDGRASIRAANALQQILERHPTDGAKR